MKIPRKKKKGFKEWLKDVKGFTVAYDKPISKEGVYEDFYSCYKNRNNVQLVFTTKGR